MRTSCASCAYKVIFYNQENLETSSASKHVPIYGSTQRDEGSNHHDLRKYGNKALTTSTSVKGTTVYRRNVEARLRLQGPYHIHDVLPTVVSARAVSSGQQQENSFRRHHRHRNGSDFDSAGSPLDGIVP